MNGKLKLPGLDLAERYGRDRAARTRWTVRVPDKTGIVIVLKAVVDLPLVNSVLIIRK